MNIENKDDNFQSLYDEYKKLLNKSLSNQNIQFDNFFAKQSPEKPPKHKKTIKLKKPKEKTNRNE